MGFVHAYLPKIRTSSDMDRNRRTQVGPLGTSLDGGCDVVGSNLNISCESVNDGTCVSES